MPRLSIRLLDWVITGCGALMLLGLVLVSRASNEGPVENPLFQPSAIPIYAGLLIAGYVLLASADPSQGVWRRELPAGYGVAGIGLVLVLVGLVTSMIWELAVGSRADTGELISLPNLIGLVGIGMVLLGPFHAPPREGRNRLVADLPAIISLGLLLALAGGITQFANPVINVLARERSIPPLLDNPAEIWSMAANGSVQTRITTEADQNASEPAWSPDGSAIAYSRWRYVAGKDPTTDDGVAADLVIARPDGTPVHTITDGGAWLSGPGWSPDGTSLVISVNHARPAGVAAGAPQHLIPTPPPGAQPNNPPQAAAAGSIASGRQWDVAVVASDGSGQPRDVEERPSTDVGTAWSPDGASHLVHSDVSGNWEVYRVDPRTGDAVNLTNNAAGDFWATWSPDGSRIVFSSDRGGHTHLWLMKADGSAQTQLTHGEWDDWNPAWSPDGSRIAFISNRDSNQEIYAVHVDGSGKVDLTRTPNLSEWISRGAWSPDGSRIIYSASATHPPSENPLGLPLGVASIIIQSTLLAGLVLVARRVRRLPFASVTILLAISVTLWSLISQEYEFIPAGVVVGLLTDLALWRWSRVDPVLSRRVLSSGLPAALFAAYFVALALAGGVGWTLTLVVSAVALAGTTGLLMSYLIPVGGAELAAAGPLTPGGPAPS
jgi:Tol biopolymer transport system component